MKEQALVVASVGAGAPDARRGIAAVEEVLAAAAPEYTCVRAFTSPAIRRVLQGRGEDVPSPAQALERLAAEGVRRVAVQPTHLLRGYEYDRLKAEAEALADRFASLAVGRPLLADSRDIRRFASQLSQDHPARAGAASVFVGHGTDHFANAAYPALQTAFRLLGRTELYVGAVKGWPDLEDVLRQLEPGGPRQIQLLPLTLAAGNHARGDMAGDWKTGLERAGHSVVCSFTGLGELDWVREMYRERLAALLEEAM